MDIPTGIRTGKFDNLALQPDENEGNLLALLARSAENLSSGKGWPGGVVDLLAELGEITNSNRIWLFQVLELSDTHMVMNFPFEWVNDQKYALTINPRYDTKHWDFTTCSAVYRALVDSRRRREWQSVIIHELEDCDFKEYQQIQGVQSTLTIPIFVQGKWWGLLGFDDCASPRSWNNQEISLIRMAAHLLSAAALRNRMGSTRRQFEILSSITESSAWELDADIGHFWCNQKVFSQQDDTDDNIFMTLLQMVRHIHPEDRNGTLRHLQNQIKTENLNFRKDLRIRRGSEYVWTDVIAKISLDAAGHLKKMAGIIVEIPERKAQEEHLRRKASIDTLTGIANRGSFDAQFTRRMQDFQNNGKAFSLLVLDIDYFKKINDTWGHAIGDIALKHVTSILQETLRDSDFAARIGGEEFAILANCVPPETIQRLGERIRQRIQNTPLETDNCVISLTASIGTASLTKGTTLNSKEELFKLADAALYEAKRRGRNRVLSGHEMSA